jgi:glycosyltransferase involved in cell wall biosynthesis
MVSVIVPTYGRPAMALDCIDSVLKNDYPCYEVLVIDQGPGATLRDAVSSRYGPASPVRWLFLEPPGLNRARNLGVSHARGEIVAFIDDDALAVPHWLSAIAETFARCRPQPALVGGRILALWGVSRPRWYPPELEYLLGLYDIGDTARPFPGTDLPIGANMAAVRQRVLEAGGFHEGLEADHGRPRSFITGGDSMLAQQLKDAGYVAYYQPKATVYHRISPAKLTPGHFLRRYYWEGVTLVTRMTLLGQIPVASRSGIASHHVRAMGRSCLGLLAALTRSRAETTVPLATMRVLGQIAHGLGVMRGLGSPRDAPAPRAERRLP